MIIKEKSTEGEICVKTVDTGAFCSGAIQAGYVGSWTVRQEALHRHPPCQTEGGCPTSTLRPSHITHTMQQGPTAVCLSFKDEILWPALEEVACNKRLQRWLVVQVVQELRLGVSFPGIILSPMGKACVSREDKDLIAVKGLAVVDCSWNRLEDVPFGGFLPSLRTSQDWRLLSYAIPPNAPPSCSHASLLHVCRLCALFIGALTLFKHTRGPLWLLSWCERPSCGRSHKGRSTEAAAMAHSSKPCKFWEALQALLRRGLCSGPLHLRLAHGSCSCYVSLQMVLPSLSLCCGA
jgi:hypothetical protein